MPIYGWLLLLALAAHAPLLLLQLQAGSFDANTHMFFADHYAHHWFNPWNEKWFAGFSQTTYPPLVHQLIALFSHVVGLTFAYTIVQAIITIYNTVKFFIERAKQIAAVAEAVFDSIKNIATGNIGGAIEYIEKTMARFLPVVIGFLASFTP